METETATWSEFANGGKAFVEQILVSEDRNKSKRAGLRKVKQLSKVIWDYNKHLKNSNKVKHVYHFF